MKVIFNGLMVKQCKIFNCLSQSSFFTYNFMFYINLFPQIFDLYSEDLCSPPSAVLAVPFALLQVVFDQKLLDGGLVVQSRLLLLQVLQKLLPLPLIFPRLP